MKGALRSVHAKNAIILALALLGMMPYGWRAVASAGIGGGIQVLNLRGLDRAVTALLGRAARATGGMARITLGLRLALVLAAVAGAMIWLPIEPLPFVVGLSTVVPAVIWHGIASARELGRGAPQA